MSNGEIPLNGYVNPMALDASPFIWGDTAQANEFGTAASASGYDASKNAKTAMQSEPESTQQKSLLETLNSWEAWGDFLNKYPLLGPFFVDASKIGKAEQESAIKQGKTVGTFYERNRNLVVSIAIIVLALVMFSKGFGRLGQEGIQIIEKVSKLK